jgi:DNA polymerase-1
MVNWSWYEGVLPEGDTLSFDVENDFYELKKIKSKAETTVTQCAVSNGTDTYVARGEALTAMLDALSVYPGTLVAHNGLWADVPWIRRTHPQFPWNGQDTMILGYLMDETQSLSLKALCVKYLGVGNWSEGVHADPNSDTYAEYNATDAVYTLRLYRHLSELLGPRLKLATHVVLPAVLALGACSIRGIYLDKRAIGLADEFYSTKISVVLKTLREEFGVSSPRKRQLVGEALTEAGHKLGHTETGKLSTGKATLSRLKETPLVLALKEFWSLDKAYSAYVKRYKKLSETGDGRSHAPYTILRTVTGRTSSPDQQLPRADERFPGTLLVNSMFSAPKGYKLVSADYSALQFRIASWVAGEQSILQRYRDNPSFDPHSWFAPKIQASRQIGKSANFGLMFKMGPHSLVEYIFKMTGRVVSLEEATFIHDSWHAELPAFKQFYIKTWEQMKEYGYVETFTGRRRHFFNTPKEVVRAKPWLRERCLKEGINFVMGQGPEADITQIALAKCHSEGLPLNWFVHDSIAFELPEGTWRNHEEHIRYCMCEWPVLYLKEHFGVDFNMPLEIQVK